MSRYLFIKPLETASKDEENENNAYNTEINKQFAIGSVVTLIKEGQYSRIIKEELSTEKENGYIVYDSEIKEHFKELK